MNNSPLATIRCTVFNHEPYLRQCLDGFVMQKTSFAFEAIVHDDASTDSSAAIIREYADKYPEIIKPIYETENQYSRHDGTLRRIMDSAISSSSKYVAICEGDDYWIDPYKLQKQVDALEAHPECSICLGKVRVVSEIGEDLKWTIPEFNGIPHGVFELKDYTIDHFRKRHMTFQTSSFLYRKEFVEEFSEVQRNEFKPFPYGDLQIMLFFLMKGKGYYVADEMSCYRWQSEGSWSQKFNNNPDYAVQVAEGLIKGLHSFDAMTNHLYYKDINYRIIQQLFRIDEARNNAIHMLHPQYWKIYNLKTIRYVISLILHKYFHIFFC